MSKITPRAFDIARSLLEYEMGGAQEREEMATSVDRVCQKFYGQLATLIGHEGFYTLLARALYLASSKFSFLKGVRRSLESESCLNGLSETMLGRDHDEIKEGMVTVIANFIWLLGVFIGEDMALRQVRKIWPETITGNINSVSEEAKE